MKRTPTMTCLVALFVLCLLPGSALAVPASMPSNVQVNCISATPEQIDLTVTWDYSQGSDIDYVAVGVQNYPFAYASYLGGGNTQYGKMTYAYPPSTSIEVTLKPVIGAGIDYLEDVTVFGVKDGVPTDPFVIWGAEVTETPQPVLNLAAVNGTLSWVNYVNGTGFSPHSPGQGGPIGTLNVTVTQDGAPFATDSLTGTSTSWPLPSLPGGHNYMASVTRSANSMTSPTSQTNLVIPAPPIPTTNSLTGPSSVKKGKWFTISGRVRPNGSGTMRIQKWLLNKKGKWVSQGNLYAGLSGNGWGLRVHLTTKGKWLLRAYYPGSGGTRPTLASASGDRTIKVK